MYNEKDEMISKLNKLVSELEKEKELRQKALDDGNESLFVGNSSNNINNHFGGSNHLDANMSHSHSNGNDSRTSRTGGRDHHSRTNSILIETAYRPDTEQLRWKLRTQLSKMASVKNDIDRSINIVHSRLQKIQNTISPALENLEQILQTRKYEIGDLGAISTISKDDISPADHENNNHDDHEHDGRTNIKEQKRKKQKGEKGTIRD